MARPKKSLTLTEDERTEFSDADVTVTLCVRVKDPNNADEVWAAFRSKLAKQDARQLVELDWMRVEVISD